ncbi:MAG: nuclear transport factor 2 family protein [Elusimicrobiota bacterium]
MAVAALLCPLLAGCSAERKRRVAFAQYNQALQATDPGQAVALVPGGAGERRAIERWVLLFSDLRSERVRLTAGEVYATDAYFGDALKAVRGIEAVEDHLARRAEAVESCALDIVDSFSHDGEYYFRWRMRVRFKGSTSGDSDSFIGMTHIRFGPEGKVVFHQDYWDASGGCFEKTSVPGRLLRAIKGKL